MALWTGSPVKRAASALNHPNIVTVHDVIRHEDTAIVVMELVDGTSIRGMCAAPQPPACAMLRCFPLQRVNLIEAGVVRHQWRVIRSQTAPSTE